MGFPDEILHLGRNGAAPIGAVQAVLARRIQYKQHEGRPLFHWWGGWVAKGINYDVTGAATVFQFARHDALAGGGRRLRMDSHVLPPLDATASATPGIVISGHLNTVLVPGTAAYYADQLTYAKGLTDNNDDTVDNVVEQPYVAFNNVRPVAGCVYEDRIPPSDMVAADTVTDGQIRGGRDILAAQAGSYGTLARMAERLNHVHQNRGTQISWSCPADSYLEFSVDSTVYRYWGDQTIGAGSTAPSATGPAVTLPTKYSGYGIATQVRVYVYVLAAMSGSTDHGSIQIANKDAAGVMSGSFANLVNGPDIHGTSYQWYPSLGSNINPSTGAYFLAPTGVAIDRVLLGGRSEGATDKLRIKSWMMDVYPSI